MHGCDPLGKCRLRAEEEQEPALRCPLHFDLDGSLSPRRLLAPSPKRGGAACLRSTPQLVTPPTQRGDSREDRGPPRAAFPAPHFLPPPLSRGEVTRETSPSYDVTKGGLSGEEGAGPGRPRACALGAAREEAEAAVLRTAAAVAAAAEAGAGGGGRGGSASPKASERGSERCGASRRAQPMRR